MVNLESIRTLFRYSDWANGRILDVAGRLVEGQLDQPFEIGPGSLRRTLVHLFNGEQVWLQRWQGRAETPWPDESEPVGIAPLAGRFRDCWRQRDVFLAGLADSELGRRITYRDSRGALFQADLGDMLLQAVIHSTHHRAQAVNMLRRCGAGLVELDYMMWVRIPA